MYKGGGRRWEGENFLRLEAVSRVFELYCCEMESYIPCDPSWLPHRRRTGAPVGKTWRDSVRRNRALMSKAMPREDKDVGSCPS